MSDRKVLVGGQPASSVNSVASSSLLGTRWVAGVRALVLLAVSAAALAGCGQPDRPAAAQRDTSTTEAGVADIAGDSEAATGEVVGQGILVCDSGDSNGWADTRTGSLTLWDPSSGRSMPLPATTRVNNNGSCSVEGSQDLRYFSEGTSVTDVFTGDSTDVADLVGAGTPSSDFAAPKVTVTEAGWVGNTFYVTTSASNAPAEPMLYAYDPAANTVTPVPERPCMSSNGATASCTVSPSGTWAFATETSGLQVLQNLATREGAPIRTQDTDDTVTFFCNEREWLDDTRFVCLTDQLTFPHDFPVVTPSMGLPSDRPTIPATFTRTLPENQNSNSSAALLCDRATVIFESTLASSGETNWYQTKVGSGAAPTKLADPPPSGELLGCLRR